MAFGVIVVALASLDSYPPTETETASSSQIVYLGQLAFRILSQVELAASKLSYHKHIVMSIRM